VSRSFTARYPGHCANCPEAITVGDTLTYDEDDVVVHVECRTSHDPAGKAPEICPRCFIAKSQSGACACD
jgi:hypothetical protein